MLKPFIKRLLGQFSHAATLLRWPALCAVLLLLEACSTGGGGPAIRKPVRTAADAPQVPIAISAAVQSDFKKALGLMKKQQYPEAIVALEDILSRNKQLPGALVNLAIAHMHIADAIELDSDENKTAFSERYAKAEQALKGAISVNARSAVAHHQLGLLYRKTGRFPEARESYETAIDLQPDYALARLNLGILCDIYMQALECAIEHFEKYRRLVPENNDKVKLWLSDLYPRAGIPQPADEPEPAPEDVLSEDITESAEVSATMEGQLEADTGTDTGTNSGASSNEPVAAATKPSTETLPAASGSAP